MDRLSGGEPAQLHWDAQNADILGDGEYRGDSLTVTRDGHPIAELVPLRRRHGFVSRAAFARASESTPMVDAAAFRADQDAALDQTLNDPTPADPKRGLLLHSIQAALKATTRRASSP